MLRSAKEIHNYRITAEDGEIGRSITFYFDDRKWIVQYFIADTGAWLKEHRIIVSPSLLLEPNWPQQEFPVKITREWISSSQEIEEGDPVSLQKKREMGGYDGKPSYLLTEDIYETVREKLGVENTDKKRPRKKVADSPHLISTDGITGYSIKATDGEIGTIEDFIIDDEKWVIRFLVINTGDGRKKTEGKRILLSPEWIIRFDPEKQLAPINLPKRRVIDSPEYNPDQAVNMELENRIYEYYGNPA